MILLRDDQIDHYSMHCSRYFLIGFAILFLPLILPKGWIVAPFTGFMLMSLGIYGRAFRRWRNDPGLWTLALLFVCLLGPGWLYFECLHWQTLAANRQKLFALPIAWNHLRFFGDTLIAMSLFFKIVSLAFSVAIKNWKITQEIMNDR